MVGKFLGCKISRNDTDGFIYFRGEKFAVSTLITGGCGHLTASTLVLQIFAGTNVCTFCDYLL